MSDETEFETETGKRLLTIEAEYENLRDRLNDFIERISKRVIAIENNTPTAVEAYNGLKEHPEFKRVSSTASANSVDLATLADTVSELDCKIHERLGDLNVHEKQTASYVSDMMREIKDFKKLHEQDMLFIAGFLVGAGFAEAANVIKLFHGPKGEN